MKKILSSVIAVSTILSCFASFGVKAADGPTIYYSTDKSVWNEIPISDFKGEAEITFADKSIKPAMVYSKDHQSAIDLVDKTQFVYMCADVPSGASFKFYTNIDTNQDLKPWADLVDQQEWAWTVESTYAAYPVRSAKRGTSAEPITIPLRLGRVNVMVDYVEDGEEIVYKLGINGRWTENANSVSLTDRRSQFKVYTNNAFGYPIPMPGASVGNDNQTYLYSYSKYRIANSPKNWDTNYMWVGSNFSKWLEGSSYVMMPGKGLEDNFSDLTDPEMKFFDLNFGTEYSWKSETDESKEISGSLYTDAEGYAGEVIMLMANAAGSDSVYAKESDGWQCVNDGNAPSQSDLLKKSRDYNDYDDQYKYYGLAIQWKNNHAETYRTETPGADEALTKDPHYQNVKDLKYAYIKKFKPGDTVSIYNPMNITNKNEGTGLVIPIIKYYMPEETFSVSDVEAMYIPEINGVAVNTTTVLGNFNPSEPMKAIFALYNEVGKLSGCSQETIAASTSDEFIFSCSKEDAKNAKIKVFLQNEDGTPIFQSNLSEVLLRPLDD